jgi:LPS sulfotransferase NodH
MSSGFLDVLQILEGAGVLTFLDGVASKRRIVFVADLEHLPLLAGKLPSCSVTDRFPEVEDGTVVVDGRSRSGCGEEGGFIGRNGLSLFPDVAVLFMRGAEDIEPSTDARVADRHYYLLTTPRSGSTYLTDLLTRSHRLGRPAEYFKRWVIDALVKAEVSLPRYISSLATYASSANGVFGAKIMVDEFFTLLSAFNDDAIAEMRRAKVFFLVRGDKQAQAFSNLRANRLGVWHVSENSPQADGLGEISFSPDSEDIFSVERWLLRQDGDCMEVLQKNGIEARILTYESLVQSRWLAAAIVASVARELGEQEVHLDGWSTLIRLGQAIQHESLDQYRDWRKDIALFSTHSEPWLGSALGQGWGGVQRWGVVSNSDTIELVLPRYKRYDLVEILLINEETCNESISLGDEEIGVPATDRQARFLLVHRISDAERQAGRLGCTLNGRRVGLMEVVFRNTTSRDLADANTVAFEA